MKIKLILHFITSQILNIPLKNKPFCMLGIRCKFIFGQMIHQSLECSWFELWSVKSNENDSQKFLIFNNNNNPEIKCR